MRQAWYSGAPAAPAALRTSLTGLPCQSPICLPCLGLCHLPLPPATAQLSLNLQSTVHRPQSTVHSPQSTVHSPQCTVHSPVSTCSSQLWRHKLDIQCRLGSCCATVQRLPSVCNDLQDSMQCCCAQFVRLCMSPTSLGVVPVSGCCNTYTYQTNG